MLIVGGKAMIHTRGPNCKRNRHTDGLFKNRLGIPNIILYLLLWEDFKGSASNDTHTYIHFYGVSFLQGHPKATNNNQYYTSILYIQ